VSFPADNESAGVVEPGEEAFDDPAALVATEGASVLGRGTDASRLMRGDQVDAELAPQLSVQGVTVVGEIANQAGRVVRDEPVFERRSDEPNFMW